MFNPLRLFKYRVVEHVTLNSLEHTSPYSFFIAFKMNGLGWRKVTLEYNRAGDKYDPRYSPLNHVFYNTVCQQYLNRVGIFADDLEAIKELRKICAYVSNEPITEEHKKAIRDINNNIINFPQNFKGKNGQ